MEANNETVVERMYTEEELVQFGLFLLSEERTKLIKNNTKGNHKMKMERLRSVYHSDLENFKYLWDIVLKQREANGNNSIPNT